MKRIAACMMMAAGVSGMPGAATTALVYLPPRDVDPKAATLENPIPRRWSGQKAALAFSRIERGSNSITLSWADAAAARNAPKLRGDPRGLWALK